MAVVKAKFRLFKTVAVLAVAMGLGLFAYSHFYAKRGPVEGALAPASFVDRQGKPVNLDQFRGQVVLVNLWATYCPPCVAELPALDQLQAKLHDKGFRVVAISLDRGKSLQEIGDFWDARGLEQISFYWDRDRQVPGRWKYEGIPTSYLLDRTGKVIKTYNGAYKWDEEEIFAPIEQAATEGK